MTTRDRRVDVWFGKRTEWLPELEAVRAFLLSTPLVETFKWRGPCYTFEGGNVCLFWGFKDRCALGFFKGVLLKDPDRILVAPGENSRSARIFEFTGVAEFEAAAPVLRAYVDEAIENERQGRKVDLPKDDLAYPDELVDRLDGDPEFRAAFEALTPGRQRGWVLHFSGAKQAATRVSRIEKAEEKIRAGKGMNDR